MYLLHKACCELGILTGLSWIHLLSELSHMTVGKSGLDAGNMLGYPWQTWQPLKHRQSTNPAGLRWSTGAKEPLLVVHKLEERWLWLLDCFFFHPVTLCISVCSILTLLRQRTKPQKKNVSQLWMLTIRLERKFHAILSLSDPMTLYIKTMQKHIDYYS